VTDEAGLTPQQVLTRARARREAKDLVGALDDYTAFLAASPEDADAHLERATLQMELGKSKEALADLEWILARNPKSITAIVYRARLLAPLDPPAARASYEQACALEPTDSQGYYFRGLAQESLDRSKEAAADFQRALELVPADHPGRAEIEAKSPRKPSETWNFRQAPVSILIAAINITVMALHPKLLTDPTGSDLIAAGALEQSHVWSGEYWRLFTAMFLHIGAMHLVWNTYASFGWCAPIERELGPWKFLACYILSGLGASALSLLCHHVIGAGASGALFGIIGVTLASIRLRLGSWTGFLKDRRTRSILKITVIWFALGAFLLPMDNYAHFGGLVYGFVFGWLMIRGPQLSAVRRRVVWSAAMAWLMVLCVGACIPRGTSLREMRLLEQAAAADQRKDLAEAERLYTQAVAEGDRHGFALTGRGFVREQLGNLDGAMSDFDEALRRAPSGYMNVYWGRGNVYYRRKEYAAAVDAYDVAIRLSPDNPDLHFVRGSAYVGAKDHFRAKADLETALRIAPPDWPSRAEARKLLDLLKPEGRMK
jgi:rhomboid protease GluP